MMNVEGWRMKAGRMAEQEREWIHIRGGSTLGRRGVTGCGLRRGIPLLHDVPCRAILHICQNVQVMQKKSRQPG